MTVTTIIYSYKGGQEITERHLPIYRENTDNLMIISPTDSPCILPNTDCETYEESNMFGKPMLKRQLFGMKRALDIKSDYYVFIEYDGIMLSRPVERDIIQANTFYDSSMVFSSVYYHHFPWIFPRKVLEEFCERVSLEPFNKGFVDRWLAVQLDIMNMKVFHLLESSEGFSRNTIEPQDIQQLIKAVSHGAYAIHGIKTEAVLDIVKENRKMYLKRNDLEQNLKGVYQTHRAKGSV